MLLKSAVKHGCCVEDCVFSINGGLFMKPQSPAGRSEQFDEDAGELENPKGKTNGWLGFLSCPNGEQRLSVLSVLTAAWKGVCFAIGDIDSDELSLNPAAKIVSFCSSNGELQ